MAELSLETITQLLPKSFRKLFLGYSGGVDSQVLLHLCSLLPDLRAKVVAVYIHHGLQEEADDWGEHCREQSHNLGIEFRMVKVDATAKKGESPEAAARRARYGAFEDLLGPGDVLLLAQHREDQLETVLLQLFRGGGIHGVAGMPVSMPLGRGFVLRPLLDVAKQAILAYAVEHGLRWVDDPSNLNCDFDRNFLRNQIVPLLKRRWPALDKTIARTARHCGSAAQLLDDWSEDALTAIFDPLDRSLSISGWQEFNAQQRLWILRQWLKRFGLKVPSQAVLHAIVDQLIGAKDDRNPEIRIQAHRIKKYRQRLYCFAEDYLRKQSDIQVWGNRDVALVMQNGYKLMRTESPQGINRQLWEGQMVTVAARKGGEKIKLPGRDGHHCLKKLYQEAGIPPWERDVRPLIYLDGRLAAVADLWVAEWATGQGDCYRLSWQP